MLQIDFIRDSDRRFTAGSESCFDIRRRVCISLSAPSHRAAHGSLRRIDCTIHLYTRPYTVVYSVFYNLYTPECCARQLVPYGPLARELGSYIYGDATKSPTHPVATVGIYLERRMRDSIIHTYLLAWQDPKYI